MSEEEEEEKTAEDLLLLGERYIADGRFEEAIEVYKEIIKREPTLPTTAKACNDCGVAYASLEQYEMAIGFFNIALNLREYLLDEGIATYYNLGEVYKIMGDDEKAEQCFKYAEMLKQEHRHRDEEARRIFSSVFDEV
ncbi:MAG: tetratricopeptide repeat protein [Candidatus Methanospirareceae archaeon]